MIDMVSVYIFISLIALVFAVVFFSICVYLFVDNREILRKEREHQRKMELIEKGYIFGVKGGEQ